jgi:hypothetical protein
VFLGRSESGGIGVRGVSTSNFGVAGTSSSTAGVRGLGKPGVKGETVDSVNAGTGVLGYTESPVGVGVMGHNAASVNANGDYIGVQGLSDNSSGVGTVGQGSGGGLGVLGASSSTLPPLKSKTGVYGWTNGDASSVGVRGVSEHGRGGVFQGDAVAQIKLVPSGTAIHPTTGAKGDLFVDRTGRLWFCKGGSNWHQLA